MELAALTEVAKELEVTRQGADYLTRQPDFPKPIGKVKSAGRIWRMRDVRREKRRRVQAAAKKAQEAPAAA